MASVVLLEKQGTTAILTLNRPDAFNAFDLDLMAALQEHLASLAVDPSVRAVVLTGAGKAFCAGGDLKWMLSHPLGAPAAIHRLAALFHLCVIEMRRMPKPVIGALNGAAAGGGFSTALACDFRVMNKSAVLRQAYTASGLCLDGGGTFTLPRIVGLSRALEIAAFDAPISADQALAWGLATRVCDDGQALPQALEMAQQLSAKAIGAFGFAKQLFNDSFSTSLESQLERERAAIEAAAAGAEGKEGIAAFSEKRKPKFV